MIAHVVLFNPKPAVGQAQFLSCAQLLERLAREIAGVRRAAVGRRVEVDAGYARPFGDTTYRYLCVLEFDDKPSLISYLNHELHRELGRLFWEISESALVIESEMVDAKRESVTSFLV
jgi:hypothetical protein